jgi:hypothetical protein
MFVTYNVKTFTMFVILILITGTEGLKFGHSRIYPISSSNGLLVSAVKTVKQINVLEQPPYCCCSEYCTKKKERKNSHFSQTSYYTLLKDPGLF